MRYKKNAFTLIELMGVIIIMGIILVIVFPSTVRLINNNSDRKFNTYYDLIENAAALYARDRYDDLGGVTASGCVEDVTLKTLIEEDYIKEFDDKEITCGSPSEFVLSSLKEIDTTKNYVDVRIRNTKGKISSELSLICVKKNKVVYSNLVEKKGACDRYVPTKENILFDAISKLTASTDDNENFFLIGSNPNNYVMYSGKMFRVVSFNKNNRTIKLVSDEVVTLLPFDSASSNFQDSNIDYWLKENFLSSLRNTSVYLYDATWNWSTVTNANKPSNVNTERSKVGLLNYYEYNKVKSFLVTNNDFWLLSRANNSNVWYVAKNTNNVSSASINNFYGVRPSIVLKANITYVSGGAGTLSNPYRLEGDNVANSGSLLNTRFKGEYVMFAGEKYRIIDTTSTYTRLIKDSNLALGVTMFDDTKITKYNSGTIIGTKLNEDWYNSLSSNDKNKLVAADFCTSLIVSNTKYKSSCAGSDIVNLKIGIPRLTDMYTLPSASGDYWTLSNNTQTTLNTVSTSGLIVAKEIEETSGIRPVINISSDTYISGGAGTSSNPYTLQ